MKLTVAKWEEKEGNTLSENGLIRINTDKPEYGSLMLVAVVVTLSGSFANKRNKVGFITGAVTDLEAIIEEYGLKEGSDYSELVSPHRIVTLEKVQSDVPIDKNGGNSGYKEKINPETNETLTKFGEPVFWKTEVVDEGSDIQNEYILHDREPVSDEAIKEFQKEVEGKK
jgi:hypothetical protein